MSSKIYLQITSGRGPAECCRVVALVLAQIMEHAKKMGLNTEVLEREQGVINRTLFSATLSIEGKECEDIVKEWEGTIQWIAQSPYRIYHKRKNWFIGLNSFIVPDIKDANEKVIHHIIDQQPLVLGKLRQEKRNDEQAIVAVHESGHAVLLSVLMKTIPEVVFSVTADSNSDGFVLSRPEWNYISKKEIINRLAVLLGGLAAERIIFGEENVTIGSSSDLSKATKLATYVLYMCGMGDVKAAFGNENMNGTPSVIFDNSSETVNKDAKELLFKAEQLAHFTLKKQEKLLIKMADYLSDKRTLTKEQVKEFIGRYAVDFSLDEIIEDAEHIFYRRHLKGLAEKYN